MLQKRLFKKTYPILTLLVALPAWGAFFGGDGGTQSTSTSPSAQAPASEEDSGQSTMNEASSAASPVPMGSDSGNAANVKNMADVERLKQKALELSDDPQKLNEIINQLKQAGVIDEKDIKPANEPAQSYQRSQPQPSAQNSGPTADDQAFELLLKKALPLSPDQIKLMHKLYDLTQQASASSPTTPPTPISSSNVISLEPGGTPPVIRLSAGFVTSLVFSDSTGAPWPIASYTLGDPGAFNIQWDQRSNTLFVQSLKLYGHGNLAVTLHGKSTPVMLSMVSGQKQVDFRIDFQVAGRGPEATAPIMTETLQDAKVNPLLINLLDGIPPKGSIKLNVSGQYGEAWLHKNKLYFRTRLTVLSPAWTGTVSSSDGMHVYEMVNTPNILASKDGQTIDIRLTGL